MASTDRDARRRRRRLAVWLALGALFVAVCAAGAWYALRPPQVQVGSATTGPAVESVYASGVVDFIRQARITPVVSSPIRRVLVAEGADVAAGQALAELVDEPEVAAWRQLQVQAEQARSALARSDFLYQRGFAAPAARESALRQYQAAAAAAEAARARLADYRIVAPFAGRVMRRDAEPGDVATPGQPLFVIADPATLRITADVDERDAGRLHPDLRALVRTDAFPGRTFEARVVEITPQGDSSGRVFRARLGVERQDLLRPGMTVEINIVLARRPRAVLVPTRALAQDHVWVVESLHVHRRAVTTGVRGADLTEIVSGLRSGERIVLDPPADLRDGQAVRLPAPARR